MSIYVKFCGGCNPHFDRMALYRRLQSAFPNIDIHTELARADAARLVIIMQGCARNCARAAGVREDIERFYVTSANDYDALAQKIQALSGDPLMP